MTNTANYSLPQWEASDRVKRSDFNAAMQRHRHGAGGRGEDRDGELHGHGDVRQLEPDVDHFYRRAEAHHPVPSAVLAFGCPFRSAASVRPTSGAVSRPRLRIDTFVVFWYHI